MTYIGDTAKIPVANGADWTQVQMMQCLLEDDNWYYDLSGDKTHFVCCGKNSGLSFMRCHVKVVSEGVVEVKGIGAPIPALYLHDMERLCDIWNIRLKVAGICVDEGKLCFEPKPVVLREDQISLDRVISFTFWTMLQCHSAITALLAGVEPQDLFDIFE